MSARHNTCTKKGLGSIKQRSVSARLHDLQEAFLWFVATVFLLSIEQPVGLQILLCQGGSPSQTLARSSLICQFPHITMGTDPTTAKEPATVNSEFTLWAYMGG